MAKTSIKKKQSENWKKVVREIGDSTYLEYADKIKAVKGLETMARENASWVGFKHSATNLRQMFSMRESREGWFFWMKIVDTLRREFEEQKA